MLTFTNRLLYLISVGILFYSSYGLSNWLTAQYANVPEIVYEWESYIPFLAWSIVPYWSLNLLYSLVFFLAKTQQELRRYISQLVVAQVIAVSCFLLFPLQFSWEKPAVTGVSGFLFDSLAAFDQPYNQAPSLHIILTVVVGTFYCRHLPQRWHIPLLLWFGSIAISILTTYQHHFIDLPTGALVGWLVVWALPYHQMSPLQKWNHANAVRETPIKWYLFGALITASIALLGGAWLWMLWISVALLLVSYAYWHGGVAVFQKRPNGKLCIAATMLLLPYLIGVRLNITCWLNSKAKYAELTPRLFIGSVTQAKRFEAVVDLCAEYPTNYQNLHYYATIPMLDMTAPPVQDLTRAALVIEQFYQQNKTVLVCCALGYGRSAAAVLVWLVVYGGAENLSHAVHQLRTVRPNIVLPALTEKRVLEAIEYLQKIEEK